MHRDGMVSGRVHHGRRVDHGHHRGVHGWGALGAVAAGGAGDGRVGVVRAHVGRLAPLVRWAVESVGNHGGGTDVDPWRKDSYFTSHCSSRNSSRSFTDLDWFTGFFLSLRQEVGASFRPARNLSQELLLKL